MWNLVRGVYQYNKRLSPNKGVSLVEILVAITLLSIIIFPLFISLTGASKSNSEAEGASLATYYAIGKMEEVLAMDFSAIPVSNPSGAPLPSPISDTVTIKSRTTGRNVYVEYVDGNGDNIPDAKLKKITVTVDNISFSTLKTEYSPDILK